MRLYTRFFAMHLQSQMQYKVSFFLTSLGQFLVSFTALLGIWFMFDRFHAVDGFAFEQTLLCFAVVLMAFSLAEMLGRGFDQFPSMLGNGELDRILVRPRGVIFQVLASKVEFTRLGRMVQALVVLGYALPTSQVSWSWDKVVTLVLMIAGGAVIFFGLFLAYAAFAFFTIEGLEVMNIVTDGGREFGRYPFSIYGKPVLVFLTFVIPLALFQYYPLLYLLGQRHDIGSRLAPVVGLVFVLPCYGLFRFGLRHYRSTGS